MRIIITSLGAIVLQIIKLIFLICKGLFFLVYLIFSYCWHYTNKLQRIIYIKIYKWKKSPASTIINSKPVILNPVIEDKTNIVGLTKTEFIKELPKLKTNEPFISEPLETDNFDDDYEEEEPDIDPNDVEVGSMQSMREILEEEEPELFSNDRDMPSEDLSSGVTMEELAQTYETLKKRNPSLSEENKAIEVLNEVEGTIIFQFYMTQDECTQKAKELMERKKDETESSPGQTFDISKYI